MIGLGDKVRDVRELIERITTSERMRTSSHFSDTVYRAEPIITTGRQMASYLPDRYREMRAISRWQEGEPYGRWLSEAELFYRQGTFMADYEDDCPYRGTFKAYFPTYSAMSDRQLRGYFTWRAAVRRGDVQETSLSFAYVYLYELINGIGVADPLDGFAKLKSFWEAYRAFAPEIDRYVRVWLRDYVVYHGLDPTLLDGSRSLTFDRALVELVEESAPHDPEVRHLITGEACRAVQDDASGTRAPRPRRRGKAPALPLPPDTAHETRLLAAIDALSTYRIRLARLYRDAPDDLRHVACAVFVRMLEYYRKHRKNGLIETLFGERATMPYTMFASAVFFESEQHGPTDYKLDAIHRYRCRDGLWTCTRIFGARDKSPQLGSIMRDVDRKLREALEYPHLLKAKDMPKYLEQIIDREIEAWLSWKEAHAPRRIAIDLSQLAGIRSAAASTREALLTDEERGDANEDSGAAGSASVTPAGAGDARLAPTDLEGPSDTAGPAETSGATALPESPATSRPTQTVLSNQDDTGAATTPNQDQGREETAACPAGITQADGEEPLSKAQAAFVRALLAGDVPASTKAVRESKMSEDMLIDAINEALFDVVGDTVIEVTAEGPHVIEDYEDDVKEALA